MLLWFPSNYSFLVFENRDACTWLLAWAGLSRPEPLDFAALREASIDRVADAITAHLQVERLFGAIA